MLVSAKIGPPHISLLYKRAPDVLAEIGDKFALYLMKLENELTFVRESSAFKLKDKIALLPIYINLDVSVLPPQVLAIMNSEIATKSYQEIYIEKSNVRSQSDFRTEIDNWTNFGKLSEDTIGINPIKQIKLPNISRALKMRNHYLDHLAFQDLHKEGIPEDILSRLRTIQGERIRGQRKFLETVRALIGDDQSAQYESVIMNYTKRESIKATVSVNGALFYEQIKRRTEQMILNFKNDLISSSNIAGRALTNFHSYVQQLDELMTHNATKSLLQPDSNFSLRIQEFDQINTGLEQFSNQFTR